ncbi:MAG: heavy metal sensor histidine kinase [Bacteroidetes bacterium]|jgi:two-component system heavy metal sensor histidine kinase CusS|nr:heavy metal sensor histidine kinase [Bacteroidota bacterium]
MIDSSAVREKSSAWSIKRKLTILYVVSAFGILLISTVFLYWVLTTRLAKEDGQFLAAKINLLREILAEAPDNKEVLQEEVKWETAPFRLAKYYARILDSKGRVIIETDRMDTIAPSYIFPVPAGLGATPSQAVMRKSPNGHNLLLMTALARVGNSSGPPRILQLALDISHEDELISDYRSRLLLVLFAGILLSAAVGVFIAGRGLKPIEKITRTVQHISAHQLHRRLGQSDWPMELNELAGAFDGMLDRLEDSFNRLSQFSADLAHELRTPINNLIGETEVALSRERAAQDYREVLESSLEEYSRLSHVIESLLFLARAESPEAHIDRKEFDPFAEIEEVIEFYEAMAEEKGVTVKSADGTSRDKSIIVKADSALFRQALSNLISNSIQHTTKGGKIVIEVKRGPAMSVDVSVADSGEGVDQKHLSRIFDRFYRADSSRSEKRPGTGLGLAIVKSIMQLHKGNVSVTSEPGKGTTVTLSFPA